MQRKYRDTRQFKRYKEVLGKDAPKDLETLQDIKYNKGQGIYYETDYRRRKKLMDDPKLALPNADKATIDDRKFTHYLFNENNEDGAPKGKALKSRLGYDISNWQELKAQIMGRRTAYPCKFKKEDKDGRKYEQSVIIYGKKGKPANVIVGWQVKEGKTWMSTAYITEIR